MANQKVLVIDDEEDILELLKFNLKKARKSGYDLVQIPVSLTHASVLCYS
ncbi:MAG: hypothetical protein KAV69_05110 [Deltaproteobacteria bacterium]|nr:hypothetical protein [Deltaproteobacteria bacterium]